MVASLMDISMKQFVIMSKLVNEEQLEAKHRDHKLTGNYKAHIGSVILSRTGCSSPESPIKIFFSSVSTLILIYSLSSY